MDAVETRTNCEVRDIPPVPIKTYQWEDVRRARKRGLYPFTHLTKEPYDQEVDPEEYTMEAFRRSKSASTLGKGDSEVVIREITEIPSKDYLEVHPSEGIVESAESSDNISQYLDKDGDDRPEITEQIEIPGTSSSAEEKMDVDEQKAEKTEDRAKSEEPKRKRKLSIESSYSRISLSRLGVMKKLREAKEKLKLPKLSFSKSDSKLDVPKKSKKSKDEDVAAKTSKTEAKKIEGPLYIHIPLKPPPGQTDEFSYLEFEDPKSDPKSTPTTPSADDKEQLETKEDAKSDIQFIILTAPSDDEGLEDHAIMPDTPSSEKSKFFETTSKIKELKCLAKDVVDEISPDTKVIFEDVIQVKYVDENNRPLATTENSKIFEVTEENLPNLERQLSQRNLKSLRKELRESRESLNKFVRQREKEKMRAKFANGTGSLPTLENAGKESTPPIKTSSEKIMVDEEDGLKLSAEAVKLINEELAKEKLPKTDQTEESLKAAVKPSASLKKKVSFKRRSKQEDPDGIYEDVQVTSDKSKDAGEKETGGKEMKVLDASQSTSMSVDEEKTYLDDQIVKNTSLEDDYHKWSKLPDHEYEPVNPPDEGKLPQQQQATPEVQITAPSVDREVPTKPPAKFEGSVHIPLREDVVLQSDTDEALTAEEIQSRIEDRFFNVPAAPQAQKPAVPPPPPTPTTTTTTITTSSENKEEPLEGQGKKLQDALKNQAEKIRSKFRNIKKPDMTKFKVEKPKLNLPKIPDQVKVSLPSFTLPKKGTAAKKRSLKERQLSTESNAGDSKKKLFDFSTYPRIFSKKKKQQQREDEFEETPRPPPVESSTVPRTKELILGSRWGQKLTHRKKSEDTGKAKDLVETKGSKAPDVIRIPLHAEESMDRDELDEEVASHTRYDKDDIDDMDDAYLRENQEIHRASPFSSDFSRNRWNRGSFHGENLNEIDKGGEEEFKVTDLDNDAESPPQTPPQTKKLDVHSVSSSGDVHRRGVVEEIDSDEFFLRQKGISQDNIEMGEVLSWEIREAFRQPVNPLSQMSQADDDLDASDQSLQQEPQKRKPIKKPKRKKTPHVSNEEMQDSEPEEYQKPSEQQPPRPKRKSQKKKNQEQTIPYQETIPIRNKEYKSVSDNVLNEHSEIDDRLFYRGGGFKQEYPHQMYENQRMAGIEQPNILVSDPYERQTFKYEDEEDLEYIDDHPEAPPRKNRSLKSLTSEHDSITDEIKYANQAAANRNVEAYRAEHDYIIPTSEGPPVKPARTRSRTRSQSRTTTQGDDDISIPSKNGGEFFEQQPCVEEPCVQQVCDYMGYAIIDKSKQRDPPLPPPARRKRSKDSSQSESSTKFFTVPRQMKDEVPVRPLRNYSTLVPKERRSTTNITDEEKENIGNLNQYIEVDDEGHSRVLQSGDVIQKMKDRPLPAPPRPPRKHKPILKDVTHEENIEEEETKLQENEASVQTEPLPDDFVCEEFVQDKNDKIITPSSQKAVSEFEHQETITHGALVVAPVPVDYQEGPLTSFSRSTERVITVKREVVPQGKANAADEETSEVPEHFKRLSDPPPAVQPEIKVLKTQKLQVGDLDVDRLTVNELLASKIKVSEIDGGNIAVSEINPKSGSIVFGGVELPASLLQELVQRLQAIQTSNAQQFSPAEDTTKTSEAAAKPTITEKPERNLLEDIENQIITAEDFAQLGTPQLEEESSDSEGVPPLEKIDPNERVVTTKDTVSTQERIVLPNEGMASIEEQIVPIEETVSSVEERIVSSQEAQIVPKDETVSVEERIAPRQEARMVPKEESMSLDEPPPSVDSAEEEDRLIEHLKRMSDEQKKTSFDDDDLSEPPPQRPPRQSDYQRQFRENSESSEGPPPPRPPQPEDILETVYMRSQPPPSFYSMQSPVFHEISDDIPLPPRRRRQQKTLSRSSSDEAPPRSRRHRTPEASIPELAGQLTKACATAGEKALKRLIKHITSRVLQNADGQQDTHVMVVILLVLIAGLILLGWGDGKTVHYHHWEYFNPPRDM